MKMRLLVAGLVLAVLLVIGGSIYATGKTYYVPKDFATLQEAINEAKDGDTIVVAEGTYKGNIYFKGKSITLTSTNPDNPDVVANTIIEGTEDGSAITINSDATLKGFTVTSKNIDARSIYIQNSNPTIENCTITGNETTGLGGGIYISNKKSKPQIINCVIRKVTGGTPEISQSVIGEGLVDNTVSEEPSEETTIPPQEPSANEPTPPETTTTPSPIDPIPSTITEFASAPTQTSLPASSSTLTYQYDEFSALENYLFVATGPVPAAVYKYIGGDSAWGKISPTGSGLGLENEIASLCEYNGTIYAATNNPETSCYSSSKIWKYEGDTNWKLISEDFYNFDNYGYLIPIKTYSLAVFKGKLYAGTTTGATARLYRYDPEDSDTTWTKVIDTAELGLPWTGFQTLYVWGDLLYIGNSNSVLYSNGDYCYPVYGNGPISGYYDGVSFKSSPEGGGGYEGIFNFEVYKNTLYCSTPTYILDLMFYNPTPEWHPYIDYPFQPNKISLETFNDSLYYNVGRKLFKLTNEKVFDTNNPILSMTANGTALAFGTTGQDGRWENYGSPEYTWLPATSGDIYVISDDTGIPQLMPAIPVPVDDDSTRKDIQTLLSLRKAVWYVDDSQNNPPGDGKTWKTAFRYLQDALNNPLMESQDEIWVAQGTYKPDQGNGIKPLDRNATFQLINGVTINGGYAGLNHEEVGASSSNTRDIANYQTILSGDIDNDETPSNNSYTVVKGPHVESVLDKVPDTLIDGFTITKGNAEEINDGYGGGMTNYFSYYNSIIVKNCIFKENYSASAGGAMFNLASSLKIINCFFVNNSSYAGGGAIVHQSGLLEITNCVFSGNFVTYDGEEVWKARGGAIAISNPQFSSKIINCSFYGNSAGSGSSISIYCHNTIERPSIISNCILWGNNGEEEILCGNNSYPTVTYCDIEGGYAGEGNINSNPLFADTELIAGADGMFRTEDDGLRLQYGSPCIDTANDDIAPATDILGRERIDIPLVGFSIADMGAYEWRNPQPVHFTGAIMADQCDYETQGWSEAFAPEDSCLPVCCSNLVEPGKYPNTAAVLTNAAPYTLDGIAIRKGTRLIIYSEPNFQGEILLDKTGPAIINNILWLDDTRYNGVMTRNWVEPLQSEFPQSVREWSKTYMHDNNTFFPWQNGSFKIE